MYAMDRFFNGVTYIFDPLHHFWEKDSTQRTVGGALIVIFVLALITIELNRQGLLSGHLAQLTPTSHYMAINLAFTLVLVLEVISLIFTLPCSISKSVGKQFEILALILLRSAFKGLAEFPEPLTIVGYEKELLVILADGGGAVVIFALLGVYRMLRQRMQETGMAGPTLFRFVAAKKLVALCILAIFIGMAVQNCLLMASGRMPHAFFEKFYTVLIFSDIMLVLIAQRFLPEFRAVFRNSGFALATLLIRVALTAPPYNNVLIGIGAAVFACALTLVYNTFYSNPEKRAKAPR
ncbi:hypothetical protein GKC30_13775 [Pseudodesulfovibrio sp. F-1]|uniref:Uncharacterized protein n=1 Tax=Pseudodesulfovibrio alkaliphilus TaxID=2661613 RepID=A0A7K1KRI9_9BACT|nr:hypothetical protein [Pseudodesulfovibrio alkaliphilus]MUM78705.1 hypothetical protein [Pseudodesulfovibrio alkaliphilus]